MTQLCGAVWPDHPADDRQPITCHLPVEGHNPYHHRWWYELHDGREGAGAIAWHTTLGLTVAERAGALTPTTIVKGHHVDEEGHRHPVHEVVLHPTHAMLQDNLPDKP